MELFVHVIFLEMQTSISLCVGSSFCLLGMIPSLPGAWSLQQHILKVNQLIHQSVYHIDIAMSCRKIVMFIDLEREKNALSCKIWHQRKHNRPCSVQIMNLTTGTYLVAFFLVLDQALPSTSSLSPTKQHCNAKTRQFEQIKEMSREP